MKNIQWVLVLDQFLLSKSFQPDSFLFFFFFSFSHFFPPFLPLFLLTSFFFFQLWRWLDNMRLQHLSLTWGCYHGAITWEHHGVLLKRLHFPFRMPLLALIMRGVLKLIWQGAFSVSGSCKLMDPLIPSAPWHFLCNPTIWYNFPSLNQLLNVWQY